MGKASADLYSAGLDAISSPTARIAGRMSQLTSVSNDKGGRDITGVKDVHVRMIGDAYTALSRDTRFKFVDEAFREYKEVSADGSFGKMESETHVQEGAIVALTSPGTWGDYQLTVSSIDITVSSGDENYYLGALVETSDGKVYGMRHNNNLWFNAKDLAISTAEFVEPHGVSRSYAYTSDMEGKTITKITYMLKDLPDEIVNCEVFLKLKTSASVAPKYEDGWHAFLTTGEALSAELVFSNVPSSADYSLSGVTFGTGRNRQNVTTYVYSNDVLTFTEAPSPGTYTATFTDKTYANIAATIKVFTVNATDKVISADKNAAGINFMLTPSDVMDAVDKDMADNKFVPASEYTDLSANVTEPYTAGYHEIAGSGFSFDITLKDVPAGFRGIAGFGKMAHLTPENCEELYPSIYSALNAMPTGPSGYKEVASMTALKSLGIRAIAVQPDGSIRDVSEFTGAGVMILSSSDIMVYYGTMMADCVSSDMTEGEHMLSPEGENIIADGKADGHVSGVMYLEIMKTAIELLDEASNPAGIQFDTLPAGFIEQADKNVAAKGITWVDERNMISGGSSALVTGKANQVSGNSGYVFTIPYDRSSIPSGHTAALGFERSFFFTRSNLGDDGYNSLVSAMSSMTNIPGYEWRMPTAEELHALGLAVVSEYPDGTSRDVTGEASIGLLASGDSVLMQYGAIALDRAITANEGELLDMVMEKTPLVSDGLADGKITVTWYITRTTASNNGNGNEGDNSGNNAGNNSGGNNEGDNSSDNSGDNSGNNEGGSGTTTYTAPTTKPDTASETFSNGAKDSAVREALGKLSGKVSSTTPVEIGLPASAIKGEQKVARIDTDAVYLPVIEVSEAKIYVFGVSLDKFNVSDDLHWNATITNASTGDYVSASDAEEAVTFFTDEGTETSTVPENKHVNVAAYFETGKQYQPVISTSQNSDDDVQSVGSSSGGCNEGFILPVMLLGLGFMLTRKR